MATDEVGCPLENVDKGINPSDVHCGAIGSPCKSSGTRDECRVIADDNAPNLSCTESKHKCNEALSVHMNVPMGETGQECSGEKTETHRGLKGRWLIAPLFKRKKFQSEPGTPSDSDSSDTKERRRENVTTKDWPAWKSKKAKLEVATTCRFEGDAPVPDNDSPSSKQRI